MRSNMDLEKEEMPSKSKKSLMSAIILKNCRKTIKDSFVKPSHKNKGKVKLVSITSLVTKCRIQKQFCSL